MARKNKPQAPSVQEVAFVPESSHSLVGRHVRTLMMHTGITIERQCYSSLKADQHGMLMTLIDGLHVHVLHLASNKAFLVFNTNCFYAEFEADHA